MGELVPRQSPAYFRHRNELSSADVLWATAPASFAWGFGTNGFVAAAAVTGGAAAIAAIWLLASRRPALTPVAQEDFRSTDLTRWQKMYWYGPVVTWFALAFAGFAFDESSALLVLPPAASAILMGLLGTVMLTVSARGYMTNNRKMGQRRAREVLKHNSLEGVTVSALEVAEQNTDILGALIAVGAVDELRVANKYLGKLLGLPLEDYEPRLEQLASASLIHIRRIGLQSSLPKWDITLTPLGVRILDNLSRR